MVLLKWCLEYQFCFQNVNREFFMSLTEMFEVEASYGLSIDPIPGQVSPILNNVPSVIYSSVRIFLYIHGHFWLQSSKWKRKHKI